MSKGRLGVLILSGYSHHVRSWSHLYLSIVFTLELVQLAGLDEFMNDKIFFLSSRLVFQADFQSNGRRLLIDCVMIDCWQHMIRKSLW